MRQYAAASLAVLGIALAAYGLETARSIDFRLSRLFTQGTADGQTLLLIGGIPCVMVGLFLASRRGRRA